MLDAEKSWCLLYLAHRRRCCMEALHCTSCAPLQLLTQTPFLVFHCLGGTSLRAPQTCPAQHRFTPLDGCDSLLHMYDRSCSSPTAAIRQHAQHPTVPTRPSPESFHKALRYLSTLLLYELPLAPHLLSTTQEIDSSLLQCRQLFCVAKLLCGNILYLYINTTSACSVVLAHTLLARGCGVFAWYPPC